VIERLCSLYVFDKEGDDIDTGEPRFHFATPFRSLTLYHEMTGSERTMGSRRSR
jgi:hypothetical protein